MKIYLNKYQKIYHVLECPKSIKIPVNDLEAWKYNERHRFAYNKLQLAEFQNLKCAPMPIIPSQFPVVVRPIINLYGMGLQSYLVSDKKEFNKLWYHTGFWSEYLEGDHISYDLILINGQIKWYMCFQGFKLDGFHGAFDYWKSCKKDIPDTMTLWLKLFGDYTGCINIECIGKYMIECHLRMGDIDNFKEKDILRNVIQIYSGNEWKYDGKIEDIYLFPIWCKEDITEELKRKKHLIHRICRGKGILCFKIDDTGFAHPVGIRRVINLTTDSYTRGVEVREKLNRFIDYIFLS